MAALCFSAQLSSSDGVFDVSHFSAAAMGKWQHQIKVQLCKPFWQGIWCLGGWGLEWPCQSLSKTVRHWCRLPLQTTLCTPSEGSMVVCAVWSHQTSMMAAVVLSGGGHGETASNFYNAELGHMKRDMRCILCRLKNSIASLFQTSSPKEIWKKEENNYR